MVSIKDIILEQLKNTKEQSCCVLVSYHLTHYNLTIMSNDVNFQHYITSDTYSIFKLLEDISKYIKYIVPMYTTDSNRFITNIMSNQNLRPLLIPDNVIQNICGKLLFESYFNDDKKEVECIDNSKEEIKEEEHCIPDELVSRYDTTFLPHIVQELKGMKIKSNNFFQYRYNDINTLDRSNEHMYNIFYYLQQVTDYDLEIGDILVAFLYSLNYNMNIIVGKETALPNFGMNRLTPLYIKIYDALFNHTRLSFGTLDVDRYKKDIKECFNRVIKRFDCSQYSGSIDEICNSVISVSTYDRRYRFQTPNNKIIKQFIIYDDVTNNTMCNTRDQTQSLADIGFHIKSLCHVFDMDGDILDKFAHNKRIVIIV